ncbi:MAG TPA: hypothetical protein VF538_08115 [Pyrinomonadaceae bacterium]
MTSILLRGARDDRRALPNKLINCAAAFLLALSLGAARGAAGQGRVKSISGRWDIEAVPGQGQLRVKLSIVTEGGGRDDRFFKLAPEELSGLTREQIEAGGERVKFRLRRDAGTLDFEGTFRAGKGSGEFTFAPDPEFVARMERDGYGEAVRQNLFGFAIGNFETLGAQLSSLGLGRPTPRQLESMNLYGVNADFIRELKSLGYQPRSIDQLIDLRLFGASADFIRSLASVGYERPTLDQLIDMREQGVSLEYINELKALGYDRVPLDELIAMRMQGVTPDFIRKLRAEGYDGVPVMRLLDVRMLGMPAEFLRHLPPGADGPEWLVKFYGRGGPRAWMHWREHAGRGGHSFEIAPAELRGLTEAEAFSGGAPVRFQFKQGARTSNCEGWFKEGFGAGRCDAAAGKSATR